MNMVSIFYTAFVGGAVFCQNRINFMIGQGEIKSAKNLFVYCCFVLMLLGLMNVTLNLNMFANFYAKLYTNKEGVVPILK